MVSISYLVIFSCMRVLPNKIYCFLQILLTYFQLFANLGEISCSATAYVEQFSYTLSVLHLIAIGFERYYIFFKIFVLVKK